MAKSPGRPVWVSGRDVLKWYEDIKTLDWDADLNVTFGTHCPRLQQWTLVADTAASERERERERGGREDETAVQLSPQLLLKTPPVHVSASLHVVECVDHQVLGLEEAIMVDRLLCARKHLVLLGLNLEV